MTNLFIHEQSVLLHPKFDSINNYQIPIISPLSEEVITINKEGYTMISTLYKNPMITLSKLSEYVIAIDSSITQESVRTFINFLKKKGIVLVSQ